MLYITRQSRAVTDTIFALVGLSYFQRGSVNMFTVQLQFRVEWAMRL